MKKILLLLSAAPFALGASAQTEPSDSLYDDVQNLNEIVIEAPKVIRKADMDVYHPSKSAVNNSKDGLQLLNNLMIPTLNVNDALNSVTAAGESVQIRINGRVSTIQQLRALLPETIKRVEWLDNPGLRYGGANYVLNFIVTNPTVGGSLQTYARPGLTEAFGFYNANAKFNIGRSQWEIGGNYKLTNNIHTTRDYEETFTRPDGSSITRIEEPLGGYVSNSNGGLWTSYNYIKPDTTVFMVDMGVNRNFKDGSYYYGLLKMSDNSDDLYLSNGQGSNGTTPWFSAYLQQSLPGKQMLVMNFNTSFYNGRSYSDYIERLSPEAIPATDVSTYISDRNQVYFLESDYIKNWEKSRLTAGASYTANRNRSEYRNLGGSVFHQSQNKAYFFAEYFQRLGKWTATAGMGVQYTDFKFRETDTGNHSWSPRPQATVTYALNQNHNFRLNFTSWQSAPSLAQTNIVPQQLDGFQWRVGNQDLKTSNSYMLTFRYGFNLPRVTGSLGVRAFTSPNAITSLLYWEGDRLITTYENSRGLRNLSFFLSPQIEIIKDWLTVSGYLQYRKERMSGTGYTLYNDDFSGYVQMQLSHRGITLSATYQRAERNLWGEKISWGEDISVIDLSYNWKSWRFGAGMLMPFGKYDQGSKSLSQWNRNEQHMRVKIRMPYLSISYNLQWGRQKRTAGKLINSSAKADQSTTGGR